MKKIKPVYGWMSLENYTRHDNSVYSRSVYVLRRDAKNETPFSKIIRVKITPVKRRRKK